MYGINRLNIGIAVAEVYCRVYIPKRTPPDVLYCEQFSHRINVKISLLCILTKQRKLS